MNLITLFSLKVRQSLQRLGNYQQGSPDDPRIPGCWQCQNLAGSVSIRKGNYVFWGYFDLKEQNIRPHLGNLGAKNITGTTHTVPVNSLKGQEGRREENEAKAESSVLAVHVQDKSEWEPLGSFKFRSDTAVKTSGPKIHIFKTQNVKRLNSYYGSGLSVQIFIQQVSPGCLLYYGIVLGYWIQI